MKADKKEWRMLGEPAVEELEVTLILTEKEANRFQQATEEVPSLLHHAGAVFRLLWSIESGGYAQGQNGIVSVLELCARAFEGAAAEEGEAIDSLGFRLRSAVANLREEQREQQVMTELNDFAARWAAQGNRNPDDKGA